MYRLFSGGCCPHLQTGRLHLFKKNRTQWWAEPERTAAVGRGRETPSPPCLAHPEVLHSMPWCPLSPSYRVPPHGGLGPPLQRRKEWPAELEGLRRGVGLAAGWVGGMRASLGPPRPWCFGRWLGEGWPTGSSHFSHRLLPLQAPSIALGARGGSPGLLERCLVWPQVPLRSAPRS